MPRITSSFALIGAAGLIALLAASPAPAQEPPAEFTVTARGAGPQERTLAAAVHLGGLDLTTRAGQAALRRRVRRTAAELCHRIGGDDVSAVGNAFSCEDDAVEDADRYLRAVIAQAESNAYAAAPSIEAARGR